MIKLLVLLNFNFLFYRKSEQVCVPPGNGVRKVTSTCCPTNLDLNFDGCINKVLLSEPSVREAWRRWKRTKPTEFRPTTLLLRWLRIRKDTLPPGTQPFQSQQQSEFIDSPYQAGSDIPSSVDVTSGDGTHDTDTGSLASSSK